MAVVRDLWNGADVRWMGPLRRVDGVELRPGDRAVVVDAGRHHVTGFGGLYSPGGPPRPRRGVRIRCRDGSEATVARCHLEVVAPDHPLQPEADATLADWWLEQLDTWGRDGVPVSSLVPPCFDAVAQVLHPWFGAEGRPVRWRQLAEQVGYGSVEALDRSRGEDTIPAADEARFDAAQGQLDDFTAGALVELLGDATSTPDDVCVAVWKGWGDVPVERWPGAAHLDTQARGHFLLRGPLSGVLTSVSAVDTWHEPTSGLWWPLDRAWFLVTEIDFEWTFVAGSGGLVERLAADDRLEVARTSFDADANRAHEPE